VSSSDFPADRLRGPRLRVSSIARSVPTDVWALGALVVLAAAIRIVTINNQSFWMDEALTAYEAHLPFGAMLNTVAHVETTPPLYFVLIWLWAHLFGDGEVALRSVSTIAGVALVPIAYLSARELVSRSAGVLAAALVALNPFLIWYSQEARTYMLLAALSGASFLWFVRARRDPTARNLSWWAVFSSLAVMTHFFAGFAVAPEAMWLLWRSRTRVAYGAVAIVAVAQLAMLPFAFTDTSHGVGWVAGIPPVDRISSAALEWGVSIIYRTATTAEGLIGAGVLIVIVAALLAAFGDQRTREGAKAGAVIGGAVIILPLALGVVGQDYFLSRNVIPAVIPLATVIAAACVAPRGRVIGGAVALLLLLMFSAAAYRVQTWPPLQRPNWRNVARALGPTPVTRAVLVAGGTTADPLKIYLPHVNWVELQNRPTVISEIDVVGATKRFPLIDARREGAVPGSERGGGALKGRPVPRAVAPLGTVLLSRFRVDNWILARFVLDRPIRVTIKQLIGLAPRYFRLTPQSLLILFQRPGR
jgi:mannosyltransferase